MLNTSGQVRRPFGSALSRRTLLRGVGVGLALPLLDAMAPAARAQTAIVPRRMFGICNNLGLLPGEFFPADAGPDYSPSPYLKILEPYRKDFTVLSGVSHPNVDGGHPSDISFLTAAPHPASSSFRNTISLDQFIAERVGIQTRFPSLTLAVNTAGRSLSWTGSGVAIPPEQSAAGVFRQMFIQGTAKEVEAKIAELDSGRSILDAVSDQVRDLESNVNASDRARLDQYFTSVRDLENRLRESAGWELKPKPVVKEPEPQDPTSPAQYMAKVAAMYSLVRLAFETDSTRSVTLMLDSVSTPVVEIAGATISDGYHNLSHHGKSEAKLAQLRIIDSWHMRLLADLFKGLKGVQEGGETLMDRTMVLYGSNLGDANAHSTTNMPTLFAGGGFKHAGHLAFDRNQNYPLPNLFVSMLQRMGIETGRFASSTGTMSGLEMTKA
jgi:BMFP domain-containing protein YqiC